MTNVIQELVSILVAGISGVATGIGEGLTALVTKIFLVQSTEGNYTLSVFGGVIVIFGGVSLAIGLSRWVTSWVSSLGSFN